MKKRTRCGTHVGIPHLNMTSHNDDARLRLSGFGIGIPLTSSTLFQRCARCFDLGFELGDLSLVLLVLLPQLS
jgi:hypothetical protein